MLVIDASIVIKWLVAEPGSIEALALRPRFNLVAPDLLIPECVNILWKKVRRRELTQEEAMIGARLLLHAEIELVPMRGLLEDALDIAVKLEHPAYDCMYLALARSRRLRFTTADARLLSALSRNSDPSLADLGVSLHQI